jgi:dTDP-4-dehydrorhamnose reductase
MKKLLILGGSGLLGSTLTSGYYLKKYNINSHSLRSKTNLKADLEDKDQIIKLIEQVKPEIIINLVGLTNVDYCEKFPNAAYRLNIKTVENIVDAIKKFSFKPFLIHISTDQVYDSEGLSLEKNINLTNFYSFSKFCGELIVSQTNSTVLRTNFFGKSKNLKRTSLTDWLYNEFLSGNEINVFEDVWFNPLSIHSLCKMIEIVVEQKIEGIFNIGSRNGMNKADFAFYFAKILNLSTLKIKRSKVVNAKFLEAYRPKNMMMNLTKFEKKFQINLPEIVDEIDLVAKDYLK